MSAIDVHAHLLLPQLQAEAETADPAGFATAAELELHRTGSESLEVTSAMIGTRFGLLTRVEDRIADMDAQGVDLQVVSPSPNHYYPWADEQTAGALSRHASEAIAAHVAQAPERLRGLGLVPLQHPALLVAALEYAVGELGLEGVEISSYAPGIELSDSRLEPFWAAAETLGAVVFVHPLGCTLDERLKPYYLSNSVGQPVEHAVALSHLIFSGVLDRHPRLKVLAAHGGGYLPTHMGRADHAWRVRPDARGCDQVPSSYLPRLWFDSLVHDEQSLRRLIEVAGGNRVLLGSDWPFDMGDDDPVRRLQDLKLGDELESRILERNAMSLFRTLHLA